MRAIDFSGRTRTSGMRALDFSGRTRTSGMRALERAGRTRSPGRNRIERAGRTRTLGMRAIERAGRTWIKVPAGRTWIKVPDQGARHPVRAPCSVRAVDQGVRHPFRQSGAEVHEMKPPHDVVVMLELHRRGWGVRRIAAELGVARNTVRRYVQQGGPAPYAGGGRAKTLDGLGDWLAARLVQHKGNAEVVRQDLANELGIHVSLRTVERAVKPVRQRLEAEARATVRFETPPGRQLQVDFTTARVTIAGERVVAKLCVLTLGHSRIKVPGTLFGQIKVPGTLFGSVLHPVPEPAHGARKSRGSGTAVNAPRRPVRTPGCGRSAHGRSRCADPAGRAPAGRPRRSDRPGCSPGSGPTSPRRRSTCRRWA